MPPDQPTGINADDLWTVLYEQRPVAIVRVQEATAAIERARAMMAHAGLDAVQGERFTARRSTAAEGDLWQRFGADQLFPYPAEANAAVPALSSRRRRRSRPHGRRMLAAAVAVLALPITFAFAVIWPEDWTTGIRGALGLGTGAHERFEWRGHLARLNLGAPGNPLGAGGAGSDVDPQASQFFVPGENPLGGQNGGPGGAGGGGTDSSAGTGGNSSGSPSGGGPGGSGGVPSNPSFVDPNALAFVPPVPSGTGPGSSTPPPGGGSGPQQSGPQDAGGPKGNPPPGGGPGNIPPGQTSPSGPVSVPEPASWVLLLTGLVALLVSGGRKRS